MRNLTVFATFFTISILLFGTAISPLNLIGSADALKSKGNPALEIGSKKVCGDKLCSEVSKEPPKQEKKKEQVKTEKKEFEKQKLDDKKSTQQERYDLTALPPRTIKTGTMTSVQDPGVGHEKHQLAVILPPSDKVYRGMLTFTSSENVQLVALHGPLKEGEDNGQPIWYPDGKTKFALTFVPLNKNSGTWHFAGNAIAVHTTNEEPFTISYSVAYRERILTETVKSETMTSVQDPGVGHEKHQLAIILPPRTGAYFGTLGYSASDDVQLVALHGPLRPGQDNGQAIWSPDGKTKFALTFIDRESSMGTWQFSANAIALHSMDTEPFTVSYSVVTGQ